MVEQLVVESDNFVVFVQEQYESIVRDAYFIVGNRDAAFEIADEAFIRAFIRWQKIFRYDKPGAWVRRVAIRLATRSRKRRYRESGRFNENTPSAATDHDQVMDVRNAILKLTRQERAAVILHYYDDLPLAAVGETLGCKEATVKRYLFNARERLRRLLSTPD